MTARDDLMAQGRARRATLPRKAHAELALPERDPVAVLEQQNATRIPELVPVRMGRMLQSPFTFYRGSAAVMAHDLTSTAVTGTRADRDLDRASVHDRRQPVLAVRLCRTCSLASRHESRIRAIPTHPCTRAVHRTAGSGPLG